MHVNRREFLRKSLCAALGGVGLHSALGNLQLIAAATAATSYSFSDYKALVCVYLYGGNDSFNTIVPMSGAAQTDYLATRGALAIAGGLHALNPLAGAGPSNYGLHPAMPELAGLFNAGHAAVVANAGSLLYPITQAQYQSGSVPSPAQLFSHDDQTTQWQTSRPDDANANGWGGRIADLVHDANSGKIPMSISLAGDNRYQRGLVVNQYAVDSNEAAAAAAGTLDGNGDPIRFRIAGMNYRGDGDESWVIPDNPDGVTAYGALIADGSQVNVLERAFANGARRALDNAAAMNGALDGVRLTTLFPDTDLGNQLAAVAMLIKVRAALGMSRQVYFVAANNYDTHSGQATDQQANLAQLSQALAAFHAATVELGVADGVTAFTASDFGRSLGVNNDGTDHGWGAHHFVVGGGVRGQRFYGTMPSLKADGNPDDTGYGQIIPTLAVDQYAATLAAWFGVGAGGIADVFPNLGRFDSPNLGFMA